MSYFKFFIVLLFINFSCLGAPSLLVADAQSGFVLEASQADTLKHPASLTKVMTLYVVFEALNMGILNLNDPLPISKKAEQQPRSKIYVKAGDTITVQEAISALIVKSANDVAVVLAEALAPTEEDFALIMTSVAQDLGLRHTVFKNASGLHHKDQVTTARDMAILTIALINHYPQYYKLFSTPSFSYHDKKYYNHNVLLTQYKGAEGLKTGFISAVGYNIISTAKRDNTRLISIVIGDESVNARNKKAMQLLDKGFAKIKNKDSRYLISLEDTLPKQKAIIPQPRRVLYQSILENSVKRARYLAQQALSKKRLLAKTDSEKDFSVKVAQGSSDSFWAIQVGAFSTKEKALKSAKTALSFIEDSKKSVLIPKTGNLFRARISGFLTKDEAINACHQIEQQNMNCFSVAPSV